MTIPERRLHGKIIALSNYQIKHSNRQNTVYKVIYASCFLSANSTLKPRIIISRNYSKRLNLPDLQETVLNLLEIIFHDFYILAKIAENGCTREKPDIRYVYMYPYLSRYELFCLISYELFLTHQILKEVVIRNLKQ